MGKGRQEPAEPWADFEGSEVGSEWFQSTDVQDEVEAMFDRLDNNFAPAFHLVRQSAPVNNPPVSTAAGENENLQADSSIRCSSMYSRVKEEREAQAAASCASGATRSWAFVHPEPAGSLAPAGPPAETASVASGMPPPIPPMTGEPFAIATSEAEAPHSESAGLQQRH